MSVHSSIFSPTAVHTTARITAILIALACADSTSPPPAPTRYLVTSNASSPIAGSQIVLTAQLVDANDNPVAIGGRTITWINTNAGVQPKDTSGGAFSPVRSITMANGSASTTFLTNTVAGVTHRILAIDSSGIRGAAGDITTVTGPGVAYTVTPSTTQPIVGSGVVISAQLTDHYQNTSKTAGRVVTWSSNGNGGSFSSPTSTANSDGIATVTFTVRTTVGVAYTVSAIDDKLASGVSAVFAAIAGPVAQYILSASVMDPPAGAGIIIYAQASDAQGNAVPAGGRLVTWTKTGSGGSFSSPSTSTSDGGGATVTFTTGTVAGTIYTITGQDAGGFSGTSSAITTQSQVSLTSMATGIGAISSCGIASDGKAWCWGANGTGGLGNGTTVDRSLPGKVSGNLTMTSLSVGLGHACGVTTSGVVQCWGNNSDGELGDNTMTSRSVPAPIASSLTFTSVTSGGAHTCAVASGGDAYCWGANAAGRLGDGSQTTRATQPVKVAGGLSFASVAAGGSHTCGVTTSGDAYCWGFNASGRLGDNSVTDRSTPVAVAGGLKFTSVSAGDSHSCGIVVGGAAYCWGDDTYGQLGDGTLTAQKAPTLVIGGMSFVAISAGGFHTCGITTGSAAMCWGDNSTGELGDLNTNGSASPSQVAGGLLFKSISAGGVVVGVGGGGCGYYACYDSYVIIEGHSCGVTTAGVTYCWGSNDRGELGYGPTAGGRSTTPFKVGGQP